MGRGAQRKKADCRHEHVVVTKTGATGFDKGRCQDCGFVVYRYRKAVSSE